MHCCPIRFPNTNKGKRDLRRQDLTSTNLFSLSQTDSRFSEICTYSGIPGLLRNSRRDARVGLPLSSGDPTSFQIPGG